MKPSPIFGMSQVWFRSIEEILTKPILKDEIPKKEFKYKDLLDTVDRKDFTQWMYYKLVDEGVINPDDLLDYPSTRDWEILTREEFKREIDLYKAERGYKN